MSTLPRLVFISKDVEATQKMSITALMNRFCEYGYDVTLISETFGNHLLDYKCDHRLKRLSMDMGVKNCAARAEILAYFVSRMPPSIFILTDFDREAFREYPTVIKAQSDAHKVICLLQTPCDSVPDDHCCIDVVVSNCERSHSVYIPWFFPYGAEDYRQLEPGGGEMDLSEKTAKHAFELWEELVADVAAKPEGEYPDIKLPAPRKSIRNFIEKKFYYRERQRVSRHVIIQMSPEQIRKSQLLASKMLVAFERICQKHGLRYYVAAGSLLGAARHGGPIDWDDDVDVTMPRPDYDRFIKIAQDELPDGMELPENNFPYGFHRMQIRGTKITRPVRQKGPRGVFLDIVPLDGAAPTPRGKKLHGFLARVLLNCMNAKNRPLPLITTDILRIYECVKRLIIICFAPRWLLFWLWKRVATRYDTGTAAEWVCLPGLFGYEKECFPKEYWGEPVWLMYEGREVPVMREWEKYLTAHYGDYRMPTPVLCRRTHPMYAIDFGKYEAMTVQEIQKEVEEFGGCAQNP